MDGSNVFAMWRQRAPDLVHASLHACPSPRPKQRLDRF